MDELKKTKNKNSMDGLNRGTEETEKRSSKLED